MNKRLSLLTVLYLSAILIHYEKINIIFYIFFSIIFFISIFFYIKNIRKENKINLYLLLILFYVLQSTFITFININKLNIFNILKMLIFYSIIFISLILIRNSKGIELSNFYKNIRNFGNIIIIINIIEIVKKKSIFYVFLKGNSSNWQISSFGTNDFRTFSIFAHPISYAVFLGCLWWINIYMPVKNKYIRKIISILLLMNIYFTKSRSVWISFIISIIIYIFININFKKIELIKKKKVINLIFTIIISSIVVILASDKIWDVFYSIYNRFITVTNDSYNDFSRIQRIGAMNNITKQMFNSNLSILLMGNGFGAVNTFMTKNFVVLKLDAPDCGLASIFYDFGLIGVTIFTILSIYPTITILKKYNKNELIYNISTFILLITFIASFFLDNYGWVEILSMQFIGMASISSKTKLENYKNNY